MKILAISMLIFSILVFIKVLPKMIENEKDFKKMKDILHQRDVIITLMSQIVDDKVITQSLRLAYINELHKIFKMTEEEDYKVLPEEIFKDVEALRERYTKIRSILTPKDHE